MDSSQPNKRVKIQIGRPSGSEHTGSAPIPIGVGSSSNSASSSNASSNKGPISDQAQESLYDLCDASFLRKKRKGQKAKPKEAVVPKPAAVPKPTAPRAAAAAPSDSGPRVEFIDGKIVVQESSLVVGGPDTTLVEGEYEEIEEGVHASSRYSSFLNNKKAVCWGLEETRLFYSALQQCGMQFSLMQTFFPHRTRKELKRKYHREVKLHPELINHATKLGAPLDMLPFEALTESKS